MSQKAAQIMGILNVTPDSFSDAGSFETQETALKRAIEMLSQGASIIDIGGESTRPGATRQSAKEQIRRVAKITELIKKHIDEKNLQAQISIDTTLSQVAEAALDNGASIINDISAGREDAQMFALAAHRNAPIIIMHMQGEPANMQKNPHYRDVAKEVKDFLLERAAQAEAQGVKKDAITIDPGIGFGKNKAHDTALLANLKSFVDTGYKVMLGASRKRVLGEMIEQTCPPAQRAGATCATTIIGAQAGVQIFRVHDVRENKQALDVAFSIKSGTSALGELKMDN